MINSTSDGTGIHIDAVSHAIAARHPDGTVTTPCGRTFVPMTDAEAARSKAPKVASCPVCEAIQIVYDHEPRPTQGTLW